MTLCEEALLYNDDQGSAHLNSLFKSSLDGEGINDGDYSSCLPLALNNAMGCKLY